jgi:hypothetical protein
LPKKKIESPLFNSFKKYLPSPDDITKQAIDSVVEAKKPDVLYIKANFSDLVTEAEKEAYTRFLEAQRNAWANSIKPFIESGLNNQPSCNEVTEYFTERFDDLDRFFVCLGNSRRVRAGSTFQNIIRELFRKLNYPFTEQPIIDGQPDFLLPNVEYYEKNPVDCIIFTVKRTLRERWRQIVTEGTRGLGFFLATIDESITAQQLSEMTRNRIYLVVPEKIKVKKDIYADAANVITFEQFFENYLDPAMRRWQHRGLV